LAGKNSYPRSNLRGISEFLPHFRFKKDLILYLNSSCAAISGEFKFKCLKILIQEAGFRKLNLKL
jgi:hypothetical protein